jgi:hypothetical protein
VQARIGRQQRAGTKPRRRRDGAPDGHDLPVRVEPEAAEPARRTRRPDGPEERERRTGGPQDKALYTCRCGSTFQAPVSASVRCPHCGESQAW